jgi:molybdate transport system regulatory protein
MLKPDKITMANTAPKLRGRLDRDTEIVSVIVESAENRELAIGKPVIAMVKSSSVLLLTDPGLKTSARNPLWGAVLQIQDGLVNSEVTLRLAGGKTVCSVITHESVERLGLAIGSRACAVFKASAVILTTYA